MRHLWIDASAGIAGDMLIGALLDAGAPLDDVRRAVHGVVGTAVTIEAEEVTRAGLRAKRALVELVDEDPPHRTLAHITTMLDDAGLADDVRRRAVAVFDVLAKAEASVHGIDMEAVEFHEVGALDSIADIVGVCSAMSSLNIDTVSVGEIALGSGEVRAAHGVLPVPVPAVLEMSKGWRVQAGGVGECTTPTGMAIIAALAQGSEPLPALQVASVGVGAGTRDLADRPNVTRVVIGERTDETGSTKAIVLEANVDDLDPRLWPGVLSALMAAGADDAWLTPILMKKGRPAHTVSVLCPPELAASLREVLFAETSTLGVRESGRSKTALPRAWRSVSIDGHEVRIKLGHVDGRIINVAAEFDDVAEIARSLGQPQITVLNAVMAAAADAGFIVGRPLP